MQARRLGKRASTGVAGLGAVLGLVLGLSSSAEAAIDVGAVICSDYIASATVGRLALAAPWSFTPDLQPVYKDAIGVWHEERVYIVNRAGADNVQVLDPVQDFATVCQFSLGPDRGLKHIAFVGDGTAYVSCYDTPELLHIDPVSGAILHVISTALFADADGRPETSWLVVGGQRLFVVCERLDRNNWYAPMGDSYLLALDLVTRAWIDCNPSQPGVQGILLSASNPYCEPVREGDRLLIGCAGNYTVADGGVDVVDLGSLRSLGLEVTEAQLGGDVVDLAAGAGGRRHAVVSSATFATSLKAYTPGGSVSLLHQSNGYHHADIAYDGGFQVFVADRRTGQTGIRVFDAVSGAQLTAAPVATGLPPAFIVLPPPAPVSAPDLVPATLALAAPYPNPANPRARIAFSAPPGSVVELRVVDLRGRLVRRAQVTAAAGGHGTWEFDGLDAAGRPVASGVLRVVATGGGGYAARSFALVR
ncbi:MAG: hypothetical protein RBT60_06320 [Candidatus Krumholzibacteria bacterium]|jgi:hypothetical protein|nr:hypothetical protein [Candidatus Krumholzibacteria bacterium]